MSSRLVAHPWERFSAPSHIERGVPLKQILGADAIRLIGESFANVWPKFDPHLFVQAASLGLEAMELSQRGRHIAMALAAQLPKRFASSSRILLASLGPELSKTEGNGLAPFFYLPHANLIIELGIDDFEAAMQLNYQLTKRFSAEFSIRPFLVKYRDACLDRLHAWADDPNPHVRRLVSEGTRPRLPWAARLREFQQKPEFTLPLIEKLKDDPELFVRRSVANHLGDIEKDHPELVYQLCERWLEEVRCRPASEELTKARKWIVRHALRLPAKKEVTRAAEIRRKAQ